jgi:hypothetical protein
MNRRYSRPCEAPGREHRLGPINVKSVFLDERLRRLRLIDPALARSERRVGGTKRTPIARPALVLPRALSAQNNVPGSVPDRRLEDAPEDGSSSHAGRAAEPLQDRRSSPSVGRVGALRIGRSVRPAPSLTGDRGADLHGTQRWSCRRSVCELWGLYQWGSRSC